jgi:Cu(I)/Ag(I) efflux system membrane protein CusA/SilA
MVNGGVPASQRLIARLIAASARNSFMTIFVVTAVALWGYYALRNIPVDAIPDLSDTQVIVFTEWPGRSPDLVEDQITYPIITTLVAAPRVKFVRGQSFLGLSFVYVIFEDGTDMYWARSRVLEYLNSAQGKLPEGIHPTIGPDATGVGWVFEYALVDKTGKHDLAELRSFQDWYLRYWLEGIPGVAEVASVGGFVKQYQVNLDPNKLLAFNIPVRKVIDAIRNSNDDVGGRVLEIAGHEEFVRGLGYIRSTADLEQIPLAVGRDGVPILVRDVATVQIGPDMRRGIAELNGQGEVVGGIVVMRYGENALTVIDNVKKRLAEVRHSLPDGAEIEITYDRSELIREAMSTLRHTLIEEMIVVSLVIAIFLLNARASLVAIVTLPVGVLLAFIPMYAQHLTANIMSLGGIAVAIGAMVDAAIIIIENIQKRLEGWRSSDGERRELIISAIQEVGPSLFFALLVITISFLPIFTLEGAEGRLFKPLAFTKTYSMAFSSALAVTLIPALAVLFIRGRIRREEENPLNRWLIAAYAPIARWVARHPAPVIVTAAVILAASIFPFQRLESEFMPPLNEGSLLYMPTAPPGMSVTEAASVLQSMDRELKTFPEVHSVFGKIGRARTATDPAPFSMVESVVTLKPRQEWPPGVTWDGLIAEMDRKLRYPGMPNIWWMPIQTRIEMLATGVRSALGIKVFGPDLATIEKIGIEIERALQDDPRTKPFTRSVFAERVTGGYFVDLRVKRAEAARYGLTVGDVEDVIQSAVGGANISQTIEGRERYPINVRYSRDFREDLDALRRVLVSTPTGAQIPIGEVAELKLTTGPPQIRDEDGQLTGFVFVDETGRGIANYVADAKKVIAERVRMPPGYRLDWAGQFKYFERAKARLEVVVPVTLLIVAFLLFLNTGSFTETGIVLLAVPFSLVGAVWLLYLLSYKLSVAVWVGMIALAGLDAETGVVMLLYLKLAYTRRREAGRMSTRADLEEAIVEGAAQRIRPKLMTVLVLLVGLLPIMWSSGTGADVMRRIAAPMVGGIVTSFLLELTVYPAVYALWRGRL